jgi:cytochrome c oxidase subunit 1
MLWVCGFVLVFVMGGLTGVMIALVPFDRQVHDSFFIVAHFHYVLIGGGLFPLFGAIYYWFPKITGRMLGDSLGRWQFWLFFAGVNLTFFPQHLLGLDGMPRRIYTYLPDTGWGKLNLLSSVGAAIIAVSVVLFLANVVWSWNRGALTDANPWNAPTLEWSVPSPPPSYGFAFIPVVESGEPLWSAANSEAQSVVTGLRTDRREVLITTPRHATPDRRQILPRPSASPLIMAVAVGVTFIGAVLTPWAIVWGTLVGLAAFAIWAWPRAHESVPEPVQLPDGSVRETLA